MPGRKRWAGLTRRPGGGEARTAAALCDPPAHCKLLQIPDDTVTLGPGVNSHTRYKGCYFLGYRPVYDPAFYLKTTRPSARSPGGLPGEHPSPGQSACKKDEWRRARYPWMVSYDGTEQCESWDIGCSEVHITADVACSAGNTWIGPA